MDFIESLKMSNKLWLILLGAAVGVILLLLGGMSVFEALTITFGTVGTGGFGFVNSSIASYSLYCQIVIMIFMILCGINFNIYFLLMLRRFKDALKNSELKVYFAIMFTAIAVITIFLTNTNPIPISRYKM